MNIASSKMVLRSLPLGLSLAALHTAGAQDAPRLSALLGLGMASTPDLELSTPGSTTPALLASIGARLRSPRLRHLFVDGAVEFQAAVGTHDDIAVGLPTFGPSSVVRRWSTDVRDQAFIASTDLRVGAETVMDAESRWSGRLALGGGYLWGVSRPFASGTAGLSTGGRTARFTADAEYRRYRLPVQDVVLGVPGSGVGRDVATGARGWQHARTLLLRVGVAVPVAR